MLSCLLSETSPYDRQSAQYVALDCLVAFQVDDKVVTSLATGAYFGELGLMLKQPRKACVKTSQAVSLLLLTPLDFFGESPPFFSKVLSPLYSNQFS
jgi:CRP-like cAMP-binding protein